MYLPSKFGGHKSFGKGNVYHNQLLYEYLGKNLNALPRSDILSDFQNRNSDLQFRSPGKVIY